MGAGSDPMTETDLNGTPTAEYVFFNGKRIARRDLPSGTTHYYFSDHLGSASVITNAPQLATDALTIQDESDYYPYGGEIAITNSDPNNYKFTGKERDTESGLDEFGARYYSSALGRFMIPDWAATATAVPYADFGNPQSLNLYSYVKNNPTTTVDPDGHVDWDDVTDFVKGFGNAYVTDNLAGVGRVEVPSNAGRIGSAVGDFAATVSWAGLAWRSAESHSMQPVWAPSLEYRRI
jgi:RHS repeat-associated protein